MNCIYVSRAVLEETIRRTEPVAPAARESFPFLRAMRDLLAVHPSDPHGGAFDVPVRTNWHFIRMLATEFSAALRAAGGEEHLAAAKELDDFIAYGDSRAPLAN